MRLSTTAAFLIAVAIMVFAVNPLQADVVDGVAYVGTVHGTEAFDVLDGGGTLYFHPQPDTDYAWNQNNGSPDGTIATYTKNGVTADRDGMKTFACADVAYGEPLNTIKMEFSFYTGVDPNTGLNMSNPSINLFITDGLGHYGILAPTSKGLAILDDITGPDAEGYKTVSIDMTRTDIPDTGEVAVYEHNGLSDEYGNPYTTMTWGDIKNFTVAGFYDYQRTPEGGFGAWSDFLWGNMTNVADSADTTLNQYGITLNWGDTVGGMFGDGSGEIGVDAERAYGQAGRMIKDYAITVGDTEYAMAFASGTSVVPEPTTMLIWSILGILGITFYRGRK